LREFRTKVDGTQQTFPPPQPRVAKIKPKSVRTLHERSSKKIQIYFLLLLNPIKAVWATYRGYFYWVGVRKGLVAEDFGGYPPILSCALPRRQWFSILCSTGSGLCLLIACLVPLIAAGEGGKPLYWRCRGPGESAVSVQVGLAYILKRRLLASHLLLYAELKPFH
jgi:hypothetical protein